MKFVELTSDNTIPGSGMLRRFLGKVAGIIVTGHEAGAAMTIANWFMTLNNFGMVFPPFSHVYAMASVCNSTYADKKMLLTGCYEEEIKALAQNILTETKLARKIDPTDWLYDYNAN